MFDRSNRTEGPVSVEITLASGRQLSGKFVLPAGRTLSEALNGPSTFIEFEPEGDQRIFIAKSALECVAPLNPKPANVNSPIPATEGTTTTGTPSTAQ
jgi:hypothetical protein